MASDAPGELKPLPRLLFPGLRLVFIGYNPGITSAREQHYYAYPRNVFWTQLSESGLAGRDVGPEDDRILPREAGIGFTDLCRRPTLRASELTPAEIEAGAHRLHAELMEFQPGIACFSGKGIYQHYARHIFGLPQSVLARRPYGEQPERIGETRPWVIPSSSGLASRFHGLRLELLHELADDLAHRDG